MGASLGNYRQVPYILIQLPSSCDVLFLKLRLIVFETFEVKWPVTLELPGSNENGPSHWNRLDRTQMASPTGIIWIEHKWPVALESSGSNTNGPSHWNRLDRTQMASPTRIACIEHKWPVPLVSSGSNTNGPSHWNHLQSNVIKTMIIVSILRCIVWVPQNTYYLLVHVTSNLALLKGCL